MDYETYLRAVLDANLTEVKDEIKELIIEKMMQYTVSQSNKASITN